VQALLPAFIKRHFPERAGQLMGFYTTGIMGGAAIAAASASPLAQLGLERCWPCGRARRGRPRLWWRRAAAGRVDVASGAGASLPVGSPRAWLLMVFFGIGTGAYTLVLAWLPPFYTELGWSAADSGLLLGGLTLMEVLAGLAVSTVIHRFPDRRILLLAVLLAVLAGLACLIVAPAQLALPAVILLGCGIGALFPLSLIVSMDHVTDPSARRAARFRAGRRLHHRQQHALHRRPDPPAVVQPGTGWMVMAAGVAVLLLIALRFAPGARLVIPR
jgi:CP family cyanate transporter-like MFS transporter